MRPGAKAELVTARKMFGGKKSIGLGTIAAYRMDPKQRMQRLHYAIACAKWGTLSDGDKAAYQTWADLHKVNLFSSFLHSYLAELKEDLVLYLAMDALDGSTVKDYSKYSNDGTNYGATLIDPGFIGRALDFDGVDDYVNCGNDASLNITDAITIEMWVKPAVSGVDNSIFIRGDFQVCGYYIRIDIDDKIQFTCNQLGTAQHTLSAVRDIVNGKWQHIAAVREGSVGKLYKNGVDVTVDQPTILGIASSDKTAKIGVYDTMTYYFNGSIDEPRVYAKALTPEEILAIYRQESKWHGDVA